MPKLIDKIKPEVLKALDRHVKLEYPTSHRMIVASLESVLFYRDLTIEQVSQLRILDWCYGDNILQKKYQL